MSRFLFLLLLINSFLFSCSSSSKKRAVKSYRVHMIFQDKSGKFQMTRESGLSKKTKSYVTKYRVFPLDNPQKKPLEQSVAFSRLGTLIKKVKVMRPEKSQYRVWFEGKLYQTETSVDRKNKALIVHMRSPESKWSGEKTFIFPGGNGVFCYFTQLFECLSFTGFIEKAIKVKAGKMRLHIIWDGFPYFHEQYLNIAPGPFAAAEVDYDGPTKEGEHRFSVSTAGNAIFFLYNEKKDYAKMFWPAQGISLYYK